MKKIVLIACLFLSTGLFAQTTVPTAAATDVSFNATNYHFGKIKQNVPATYVFNFTNKSTKPIVIEFANAECGCTTPEYSKSPVLKGKSSSIKVTYNAANPGSFKKNVTIKFAHLVQPIQLTITGEVVTGSK